MTKEFKLNTLNDDQIKAFRDATSFTINIILQKNINLPLDKLINIIKDVYKYAIKADPPKFEPIFVDWILENHHII